jgi:hypothetical protein
MRCKLAHRVSTSLPVRPSGAMPVARDTVVRLVAATETFVAYIRQLEDVTRVR